MFLKLSFIKTYGHYKPEKYQFSEPIQAKKNENNQ